MLSRIDLRAYSVTRAWALCGAGYKDASPRGYEAASSKSKPNRARAIPRTTDGNLKGSGPIAYSLLWDTKPAATASAPRAACL
eukprot:6795674-Prymnesium_polylepis.2